MIKQILFLLLNLVSVASITAQALYETDDLLIEIDENGYFSAFTDKSTGHNYIATDTSSPLLTVKQNDKIFLPTKAVFQKDGKTIQLRFDDIYVSTSIKVKVTNNHIAFELSNLRPWGRAQSIIWGPYQLEIDEQISEITGVCSSRDFSIGLQALNVKTIAGYPDNEEGAEYTRGRAAQPTEFGSKLQAFSMDRSLARNVMVWGENFPNMPVPKIPKERTDGSAIALYGCHPDNVLNVIETIVKEEGLPYPLIDGIWAKKSKETGRSYLITAFSEENFDSLLAYADKAKLFSIYHFYPFKTWGSYELNSDYFPNGNEGMKKCVEKASEKNIRVGVHTLTNFINTNDPYVTPVPDKRLSKTGYAILTADISAEDSIISIDREEYFNNFRANWLRSAVLGDEIIRYDTIHTGEKIELINVERGAFGTTAREHFAGDSIGKLLDHAYKVFFPNLDMQTEIARNLATLFNETGISHMDFDGHEGCWGSGQGDYAVQLFAEEFYRNLDHMVVTGTSRSGHYYWHINHYYNWGEPWYAGFRESMQSYRFNNQPLLDRNYMPNMLGWFLFSKETVLEDIEWLLARGAGYDAGFALVAYLPDLTVNKQTDEIFESIRLWEDARLAGVFPDETKELLKRLDLEFRLKEIKNGKVKLICTKGLNYEAVFDLY